MKSYPSIYKNLYEEPFSQELILLVENGKIKGMTFEGIITKANSGFLRLPWMTKVKNKA